jgi:mono/diheme cytochrome c family protein
MKFRIILLLLAAASVLSACSFSLAEDITPPPDYVSPTTPPDLGPLYPSEPPSPARGEEFYATSCAPCHGEDGLGNGVMASSMPVAVPAIGLRDIASMASPAEWYEAITNGNIDRGMPPFVSHSSEERWDVLAYTYSLSTTKEELTHGAEVYEANCSECHGVDGSANPEADLTNQDFISQTDSTGLYRSIAEGKGEMKSFAESLTDEDIWAVTSYLRSLSFDMSAIEPTPTHTLEASLTPEGEITSTPDGTQAAETEVLETPGPVYATITGLVTNASGTKLVGDLVATLVVYNTTDGQVFDTQTQTITAEGTFEFNDIFADAQIAYWVSVDYQGVTYYSDFIAYDGTTQSLDMPVTVYDVSTDWQTLEFELVHIALDVSNDTIQVSELYVISNPGPEAIFILTDGKTLPFIALPDGASELTSLSPDSRGASFLPATGGVALPPSADSQYGVVATFSIPYDRKFVFQQPFPMPISSISLFVPEGVNIKTSQLGDSGTQDFSGTVYHVYEGVNLPEGDLLFTITGTPGESGSTSLDSRSWLIIAAGALGVVFVVLGIFLFLRDRAIARKEELEENKDVEESEEFPSNDSNALLDAIIALDEQLKNGEITKETHEKRISELKARLKEIL